MEQSFLVPERECIFVTESIQINLLDKSATVTVLIRDKNETSLPDSIKRVNISLSDVITSQSLIASEITVFKKIIKAIVASSWNKTLSDITVESL